MPDGVYRSASEADGFDEHVTRIECAVDGRGRRPCAIDYAGTSPQIDRGINCVMNYTHAYSVYPVKCALDPFTPRNEGCYRAIEVAAPEGSILNPRFPAPCSARQLTGHLLAGAIYQALRAGRAGPGDRRMRRRADHARAVQRRRPSGDRFTQILFASGGMGACAAPRRPADHRLSRPTPAPAASRRSRASRRWSSGARSCGRTLAAPGSFRGGLGQECEIEVRSPDAAAALAAVGPAGASGAGPARRRARARAAEIELGDGARPHPKSRTTIAARRRGWCLRYAGGGGYGDPRRRDPAALRADVRDGYVSPDARALYGTALTRWTKRTARIGVDVGGTFTDLVLHDAAPRAWSHTGKRLTTPGRPERRHHRAASQRLLREAGLSHRATCTASSTARRWSTNTVIERTGAKVGLHHHRAASATPSRSAARSATTSTTCSWKRRRRWCRATCGAEIPGRLDADGVELAAARRGGCARARRARWWRRRRSRRWPIGFLHAYRDPRHEQRAGEIVARACTLTCLLTLSAEVAPEIREYERSQHRLRQRLCPAAACAATSTRWRRASPRIGFDGRLYVMLSGGGIAAVRDAKQFPIRLIESRPGRRRHGGGVPGAARRASTT